MNERDDTARMLDTYKPFVEAAFVDSRVPYSEETERAVLGAILLEPTVMEEVASRLTGPCFYVPKHRIIYDAMLALHYDDPPQVIDLRVLQVKLERSGKFDEAGGISYLACLDNDLPDIGHLDYYVQILKNLATKRVLVKVSNTLGTMARNGVSPDEAVAVIINDLEDIQGGSSRGGWVALNDIQDAVSMKLETGGYVNATLPTGLPDLDRLIDGLPIGDMAFIAARPGCGKSALLSQIVEHNACRVDLRERIPCGIVTLEMTNEKMVLRMIARRTGIPYKRLLRGGFNGDEWAAINAAQKSIRDAPIWFEEAPMGVSGVISAAKRLRRKNDIQLLAIDYLGIMPTDDLATKENRTIQIGEITRRLAAFAKTEGIATLVAYQLNRVSVERKDTRPDLHHLAESGAPERDANLVLMIWQELDARGVMTGNSELLVRKHRDGETGVVETLFNGPRMLFTCKENRRQE